MPTQHPQPVLADSEAVDLARAAAQEEAGQERIGAHVGVLGEDEVSVTHLFEANHAGYHGWNWAVTVAFAGQGTPLSVSEVVLLPGNEALVAPDWVPWDQRVRAGDLGVGDLMPTRPDDPRLVPGYLESEDPAIEDVVREVGLGRVRVLGRNGRLDAADRWHGGDFGPLSDMARSAPATCGSCGFYLQIKGSLGAGFGVCANELTPADGRVVHVEYGCGAHSEVEIDMSVGIPVSDVVYDDAQLDVEPNEVRPEIPVQAEAPVDADVPAQVQTDQAQTENETSTQ